MTTKMTKEELFDTFVGNVAGHCAELRIRTGRFSASAVYDMPLVQIVIEPRTLGEVDVWDMCYQIHPDGTREALGNRCAAVARYSKIAAQALRKFLESAS
jgi:hypothetical protein